MVCTADILREGWLPDCTECLLHSYCLGLFSIVLPLGGPRFVATPEHWDAITFSITSGLHDVNDTVDGWSCAQLGQSDNWFWNLAMQVLVTLSQRVDSTSRAMLKTAAGSESIGYLPDRTLMYYVQDSNAPARLAAVQGVVPTLPLSKFTVY